MRLDVLVMKQFNISRNRAQVLIKEGDVFVDGKCIQKVSFDVNENAIITKNNVESFVSRGAFKLIKAIDFFKIDFNDKVILDMGASTGGFTEVALKYGAKKVYAVDVGEGQLDSKLKHNNKVINLEKTDVRHLKKTDISDVDLIVGDISFISLTKIMPHIKSLFQNIEIVCLFKPQFECGIEIAKKYKGIVKDKNIHKNLIKSFVLFLDSLNFKLSDITFSPIKGKSGNIEYLLHINGNDVLFNIDEVVNMAFQNFKK